jgi:hypothetical protein
MLVGPLDSCCVFPVLLGTRKCLFPLCLVLIKLILPKKKNKKKKKSTMYVHLDNVVNL